MDTRTVIEDRIREGGILEVADAEIDALSDDDITALRQEYGAHTLMRLPPRERAFFDWLKENDPAVWDDLWKDDEDMLVTLAFLADLRRGGRGFLICELEDVPNYFFTPRHVKPDGIEALNEILTKAAAGDELALGEALMFEIVSGPMDIWHFCHKYGADLARAKREIARLVDHDWLVHLPAREDCARYIGDE